VKQANNQKSAYGGNEESDEKDREYSSVHFEAYLNWLPGQLRLSVPCGNCRAKNPFRSWSKQGLAGQTASKFNRLFSVFLSSLVVTSGAQLQVKEVSKEL
jgi:hypothetical protein